MMCSLRKMTSQFLSQLAEAVFVSPNSDFFFFSLWFYQPWDSKRIERGCSYFFHQTPKWLPLKWCVASKNWQASSWTSCSSLLRQYLHSETGTSFFFLFCWDISKRGCPRLGKNLLVRAIAMRGMYESLCLFFFHMTQQFRIYRQLRVRGIRMCSIWIKFTNKIHISITSVCQVPMLTKY